MSATETWLVVIPAIPLVRGVPVVERSDDEGGAFADRRGFYSDGHVIVDHGNAIDRIGPFDPDWSMVAADWRVDLDAPQGFGYALRYLARIPRVRNSLGAPRSDGTTWGQRLQHLMVEHTYGTTTDADRLALANALREVTR